MFIYILCIRTIVMTDSHIIQKPYLEEIGELGVAKWNMGVLVGDCHYDISQTSQALVDSLSRETGFSNPLHIRPLCKGDVIES